MDHADEEDLRDLMRRHELCLLIVARCDGTQVLKLEEGETPENAIRLADSLFGDVGETADLAASLIGRKTPRTVRLGSADCHISAVEELDLVFGAITLHRPVQPLEMVERGERIAADVEESLRVGKRRPSS